MSTDSFFVRRARSLMRRPVMRPTTTRLAPLVLEDRSVPAITGVVYQDFNADGIRNLTDTQDNLGGKTSGTVAQAIDAGLGGVTVTAFDAAGTAVTSTKSAADGTYSLNTAAGNYRVEFTGLPAGYSFAQHGAGNGTGVQFLADGAAGSVGAVRPADFFQNAPALVTNYYTQGDQLGTLDNTAANNPIFGAGTPNVATIVGFPYTAGTIEQGNDAAGATPNAATQPISIPANQVGSTWGLGFDRARNRIFSSTFTKRHIGYGPGGAGAIYVFNNTSAANPTVTTASVWANIGGTALTGFAGFRGNYTRNDDYVSDTGDTGWNAVGKTGFGGLDVSEDGTELYVMSLADRQLYVFPINADGSAGTPQAFPVPIPSNATGVNGSDIRPWAVQVYRGRVYVGLVNSGESTLNLAANPRDPGDPTVLRAYVFTFDPATDSFGTRSVLNESAMVEGVSLNYPRGSTTFGGSELFRPWSPAYRRVNSNGDILLADSLVPANGSSGNPSVYPQAMLAGIAFDAAGNMTLGIRDRNGDQTGRFIPSQDAPGAMTRRDIEGVSSGDILKAFRNDLSDLTAGWSLEANGSSMVAGNPGTGTGAGNALGPVGGEFFAADGYNGTNPNGTDDTAHRNVTVGGVAQVPGFPDVLTTAYDPLRNGAFRTGGVRWFDSSAGTLEKSYTVYTRDQGGNTFGKANGIGDLIAVESEAVPIEIGNRVFRDTDRDGVQDVGEPTVGGATVDLWWAGPDNTFGTPDDTQLATVTTAADGSYYFNNTAAPAKVVPGANEKYGVLGLTRTQLVGGKNQPSRFQVRFPDVPGADPLDGLLPTAATNDKSANGPARDSDAVVVPGVGRLIGGAAGFTVGATDHTLDAGFVQGLFLGDFVWVDADNNGKFDAGENGLNQITVNLYAAGDLKTVVQTTKTANGGQYQFGGLTAGQYVVEILAPAGFRSSSGNNTEAGLVGNPNTNNTDHGVEVGGAVTSGFVIRANPVTLGETANPGTVLAAGDANLFQDFGIYPVFSLGNRVWLDKNNSGTIDAFDGNSPGIDGVTVRLFRPADFDTAGFLLANAAAVGTTTTALGGYYRFDNLLAGNYVVVADGGSAPVVGLRSSTGGLTGTTTYEQNPGKLLAPDKTDSDDNGTTIANAQVRSEVFNLNSNSPLNEADLVGVPPAQGTIDGNADMTVDFGFYRPLSVGNRVFEDAGNDGKFNGTDAGIDGVTVRLFRADAAGVPTEAVLATQTTTAGGYYLFTGLGEGTYTVEIDGKTLPAGSVWYSSSGTNGSLAGVYEPAANPNLDPTDADDNGTQFQNDAAAYLIRSGPVTLVAGTEPVGEPDTPGFIDPTPTADGNLTVDFGVWRPLSLGNFVWNDFNNSGVFDAGEKGIGNVPVTLYQDDGDGVFNSAIDRIIGTQKTTADGSYLFTNLAAGSYFVTVTPPTGFASSTGPANQFEPPTGSPPDNQDHGFTVGALIRSNLIPLSAGNAPSLEPATPGIADGTPDKNADYTIDFGLFQSLRIGDFVFEDANNDGVFGAGDRPLDGIAVTLFDGAGTILATTATANGGKYLFGGLLPGQYQVQIAPPVGFRSSTGGGTEPGVTTNTDDVDHGTAFGNVIKASVITLGVPGDAVTNPSDGGFANLTQDFGLFRPLVLGNFVWEDANNNGRFDTGEAPLPGVTVTLLDAAGGTVGTMTTDTTGGYLFTGLSAGKYTVRVTPPAGYLTSTGKNGSLFGPFEPGLSDATDNADHGTLVAAFVESKVTLGPAGDLINPSSLLSPNDANLVQDFGFYRPLALGNFVWEDVNNNGKFDAGENPLVGLLVELQDATGAVILATSTDANGNYLFTNLVPGAYTVRVTPQTGYVSSTGRNGSPTGDYEPGVTGTQDNEDHGTQAGGFAVSTVTLGKAGDATANPDNTGLANLRQDFGLFRPLSLGNLVFRDANNNGKQDAGEPGITGVGVTLLDSAGATVGTTTTDANGNYLFTSLIPGTYTVRVATPTGLVSSSGRPGDVTGPYEPGVNGDQDNEDHGTTVGPFATTTVLLGPPGTLPDNGGLGNLRQDFGFTPPPVTTLSLGNLVFRDTNNNGKQDAGEPGIAGITVTLTTATGTVVGTRTTDANGNYLFTGLTAGTYVVSISTPDAFSFTSTGKTGSAAGPYEPGVSGIQDSEDHGSLVNGTIRSLVTLAVFGDAANPDAGGSANLRQDFGLFTPMTYGNTVFIDENNDGKQNGNDQGVPGVTVTLLDGAGNTVAVATTGTDGKYLFTNLIPGTYQVQVNPPSGLTASTPSFNPLNTTDNLNIGVQQGGVILSPPFTLVQGQAPLISGNTNPNNFVTGDFGLQGLAKVSGFVYLDPNIDGRFTNGQNGDRPLGGVTVTLTGNGITRTTTTDAAGFYQFTLLPPGTYTIRETQPGGILFDGLETLGTLSGTIPGNDVQTVTLAANDDGRMYNFGEIPPADPFGYVWVDANRNCQRDPGELTLAGVPVTISGTAFAGSSLARPLTAADVGGSLTILTDATGRYTFPVMPPGDYTVVRGSLTAAQQQIYADWCLQNGDPTNPPPGFGTNTFTGIGLTSGSVRGPFNFGVVPTVPTVPGGDPSKDDFLGSSPNGGAVGPPTTPGTIPPPGGPTRGVVPFNPTFATTTGVPTRPTFVVAAAGAGYSPQVRVFDYATGIEKFNFFAYETSFTGGVRTATADVTGDGTMDIVTATGVGGGPRIRVFDGNTGAVSREFFAYEPEFRGGVFVAAGDVTGDGAADVVTGTETGGGPRVTVFDGRTGSVLSDFFAFDAQQRGGVRVAMADFNGDGRADIVTTTGNGVPTRVRVFDGTTLTVLADYAPYEATFTGGVNLAAGDFDGNGTADVIVGAEAGGGPRVQVFSGLTQTTLANFFAYEPTFAGGVRVGAKDVDGDGRADLLQSAGVGGAARVRILRAGDLGVIDDFYAFDPDFVGGTYVG